MYLFSLFLLVRGRKVKRKLLEIKQYIIWGSQHKQFKMSSAWDYLKKILMLQFYFEPTVYWLKDLLKKNDIHIFIQIILTHEFPFFHTSEVDQHDRPLRVVQRDFRESQENLDAAPKGVKCFTHCVQYIIVCVISADILPLYIFLYGCMFVWRFVSMKAFDSYTLWMICWIDLKLCICLDLWFMILNIHSVSPGEH